MVLNYFGRHDLVILFPSLICLVVSIVLYGYKRDEKLWPAILFLALASLGLRIFMAHLDPFLWDWDERYHALVAKNFLAHPLIPTLYDHPVMDYNYTEWYKNHIWLHKQPLPFWQMALSFYLFGINQFTARFPMVLEGTLMTLIIYRIGSLTINKQVGYLSALIYTVSFYALDFSSGGQSTDSADFALLFYTSIALWAWIEYRQDLKLKWLLLIGISAGLAVMCKWVIGLLIYAAWGIFIVLDPIERKRISSYLYLIISAIITVAISIPWQLYALAHYPLEYKYEMAYNTIHVFKAIEGHAENNWYYLSRLDQNFGAIVPYILLLAIVFMWQYIKRKDHKIFLLSFMILPYLFFSFIATKMPAYCYFASVPVFLALGSFALFFQRYIEKFKQQGLKTAIVFTLLIISWFSINLKGIAKKHTGFDNDNLYRINKVLMTDYFRQINRTIPKDYVIFGFPYDLEIETMFYTNNTCYNNFPSLEDYQKLKKTGIKIAVIQWDKTPPYLLNDPNVLKIKWL